MKNNYVIREYKQGDESQINCLFNQVFNERRTLEEWEWKFRDNPVSDLNLITVAEVEGEIVGHYASIPVVLQCYNERLLFGQSVDTFVHPDYRGSKILLDLFKRHEETFIQRGYVGGFGFPNRQAYIVGKRVLKYTELMRLSTLYSRLNLRQSLKYRIGSLPGSIEKVVQKTSARYYSMSISRRLQGLNVIEGYIFDSRVNDLWKRVHRNNPILCSRDLPFLTWRYLSFPSKGYHILAVGEEDEINGYIVYKIRDMGGTSEGVIVDCLWEGEEVLEALITAVLYQFSKEEIDRAHLRVLKGTTLYEVANRLGFKEGEEAENAPVVYYLVTRHFVLEKAVKDPTMWYFTYGDSDGI